MQQLDILILGAGWSSTFLIPLLQSRKLTYAATTTTGREVAGHKTLPWKFDPDSKTDSGLGDLPLAEYVLITFPLTTAAQTDFLVQTYLDTHKKQQEQVHFIQFGSTGIWQIDQKTLWVSRRSPYNTSSPRAIAEDALLKHGGCVLNLAGLWGGERQPRNWVERVAKTKEDVKGKKSLHMVHGLDVARAVCAVMGDWESGRGRWMVTDGFVYDWWSLFARWGDEKVRGESGSLEEGMKGLSLTKPPHEKVDDMPTAQAQWVYELMGEERVWALPRSFETLGRCYFGREFWDTFRLAPVKAGL